MDDESSELKQKSEEQAQREVNQTRQTNEVYGEKLRVNSKSILKRMISYWYGRLYMMYIERRASLTIDQVQAL